MLDFNRNFLQTLGIAILVSSNSIAAALSFGGAYYVVMFLCIILIAISHRIIIQTSSIVILLLVFYCIISGLLSDSKDTPTAYHYGLFCFVFGLALFTGPLRINVSLFFKCMVVIGVLCSPILLLKARELASLILTAESDAGNMMGMTYAIVPSVLSALSLLFSNNNFVWKSVSFILIIFSSLILFIIGSRGAFIVFLVFLLLLLFTIIIKKKAVKLLFFSFFVITTIMVVSNFDNYLIGIDDALDNRGVSIYAISKAVNRMDTDTFSNGRTEIWKIAWDGFVEKPLGHFIGSFEDVYELHQHNFVLQLIWEFGLLGLIMALSIIFKSIVCLFVSKTDKDMQLFKMTIFCSSLIILSYSGTFWILPCFWIWLRIINKKKISSYEKYLDI